MPSVEKCQPVLLSDARVLAAYLIFFGSYLVFALGKFPWMRIDRPGAAIIGAVLMVAFRIVGAREALASIDFGTIVLLFSMMLIVANVRLAGFFDWMTEWMIERLRPHHLLPTVIFTCGLFSAFLAVGVALLLGSAGDNVSHICHLGGMFVGYLYLRRGSFLYNVRNSFSDWKRRRLRKKFEVYVRDHNDKPPSRPDNWVN